MILWCTLGLLGGRLPGWGVCFLTDITDIIIVGKKTMIAGIFMKDIQSGSAWCCLEQHTMTSKNCARSNIFTVCIWNDIFYSTVDWSVYLHTFAPSCTWNSKHTLDPISDLMCLSISSILQRSLSDSICWFSPQFQSQLDEITGA